MVTLSPTPSMVPGSMSTRGLELREDWKKGEGDSLLWLQPLSLLSPGIEGMVTPLSKKGVRQVQFTEYQLYARHWARYSNS